jgi:Ca2+/Na+ antiporter
VNSVQIARRNVRGRAVQVVEALMVAMTSAMCAFMLILIDSNCQDREKDENEHPVEVMPVFMPLSCATISSVVLKNYVLCAICN